ncbi:hypothetical protein OUZ56_026281 [Daphnia magna]|uniref:Uncharacterized protein n=1 Tax=Daphnia magna TaxID=35525 RepID=A0ABQ9ZL97_9CRUS|nr:hypothetical protein OUZ56_026281 [Daphnia magna]
MKAMVELREDEKDRLAMVQQRQITQCDASVRTRKPSVNLSPGAEEGARGKKPSGKKTLVVHVSQMMKFVVVSDEDSDSDEEVEKQEHADTDLDVESTDTDLDVKRADADLDDEELHGGCLSVEAGRNPEELSPRRKKWTGIDLFYIGGRKWDYAGKENVTIVLQCPGKRIGGIGLRQVLPAVEVIKIPRLCSATSDEWVLQASFRPMMPVKVTSVIDEEAAGMLSGLLAPEMLKYSNKIYNNATKSIEGTTSLSKIRENVLI